MSQLTFKPDTDAGVTGDKQLAVPALAVTSATGRFRGLGTRGARRRLSVTRLSTPVDDGFRPFRIY